MTATYEPRTYRASTGRTTVTVSVSLDIDDAARLAQEAARRNVTKTLVVTEALRDHWTKPESERAA